MNKGKTLIHYSRFNTYFLTDADDQIPCSLEPVESLKVERPELTNKALRKNWAPLIQKIYEVDPLKNRIVANYESAKTSLCQTSVLRPRPPIFS